MQILLPLAALCLDTLVKKMTVYRYFNRGYSRFNPQSVAPYPFKTRKIANIVSIVIWCCFRIENIDPVQGIRINVYTKKSSCWVHEIWDNAINLGTQFSNTWKREILS